MVYVYHRCLICALAIAATITINVVTSLPEMEFAAFHSDNNDPLGGFATEENEQAEAGETDEDDFSSLFEDVLLNGKEEDLSRLLAEEMKPMPDKRTVTPSGNMHHEFSQITQTTAVPGNKRRKGANKLSPKQLESMDGVMQMLSEEGQQNKLLEMLLKKRAEKKYRERLAKCMDMFNSISICTDTGGFYLWARMAARQIMTDGKKV